MENEIKFSDNQCVIIEAKPDHYEALSSFLNQNNKIHRHLDWFGTLDWLGYQPYLLMMKKQKIQAVLCATPENKISAWVRAFVIKKRLPLEDTWDMLLAQAVKNLKQHGINQLATLALHNWFEGLLTKTGFKFLQNIVVLEWGGKFPSSTTKSPNVTIRPMSMDDFADVNQVDKLAFSPIWQNSLEGLSKAYDQPGISTVAVYKNKIVGYQISTSMTIYGHLARLAVHPEYQRKGIAFNLVYDLLQQFDHQGFWRVTVNTQSDNLPSLRLYEKFGFRRTGEEIPVYELKL